MSHPASDSGVRGNVGVPIGSILILIGFFLPWLAFGGLSAAQIAANPDRMAAALGVLSRDVPAPGAVARALLVIPILALSTLMIDVATPPGHPARLAARLGVLLAGALLTAFFLLAGVLYGRHLTSGFWGSCMGALFILVGGIFNAARSE